jgi:hypothetical protein
MSNLEIRPASIKEAEAFLGEFLCEWEEIEAAIVGNEIVGMGGFARHHSHDRLWVFLNVMPEARAYGFQIVRRMMRKLHEKNETVFVQCDGEYAVRFLRLLGFEPTDEMITDMRNEGNFLRIWKWQSWQL